jgi:outer membrane protein TolC
MLAFLDRGAGLTAPSFSILLLALVAATATAEPLSLPEAQRIALERDTGLVAIEGESSALRDRAVAAGQLPDPEARCGAINLPVDSFALDADDMTMLEVGLMQRFPAGRTRELSRAALEGRARGVDAEAVDRERMLRWTVEQAWRELDYLDDLLRLLAEQRRWAETLAAGAESAYAAGEGRQGELFDARLMVLDIDERRIDAERSRDTVRSEMARWIGAALDRERLPAGPVEPAAASAEALLADLERHPQLAALEAAQEAALYDAGLAMQRYKPAFGLDLAYGFRGGRGMGGGSRPDMLSAMLTFDLPLFTRDRQDREVAAARAEARSADARREDAARELAARLRSAYAQALRLGELVALYEAGFESLSGMSVETALSSYRAGEGSFTEVIGAQRRSLTIREKLARARTDHALAWAEIAYLTGDAP